MKDLTLFLRDQSVLPGEANILQKPFCDGWASLPETATVLDGTIRNAGWHFIWIVDPNSSVGIGRTEEAARKSAIVLALTRIKQRFNSAEVEQVKVSSYPGLYVARATLHPRQIQEHAVLAR